MSVTRADYPGGLTAKPDGVGGASYADGVPTAEEPRDPGPEPVAPAGDRLRVSATCVIDAGEIEWRFGPSGGPGGQHANKASTRADARFDIEASPSLSPAQRDLLVQKLGPVLTVSVDETRSQTRNRALAADRLVEKLAAALERPRPRKATKPSKRAKARRLDEKRQRSETKQARARPRHDD